MNKKTSKPDLPWAPMTKVAKQIVGHQSSLRDLAHKKIRHLIVTNALKPGKYVNEARLSEELDIGRTPVHQAIDRLVSDTMVEVIPRKGVIIRPLGLDEILQTFDVRILTEGVAAEMAADRASPLELEALQILLQTTADAARTRDFERLIYLQREFHLIVAHMSGNPVLAEIIRGLLDRSLRFWLLALQIPEGVAQAQDDHSRLAETLRRRRGSSARKAMEKHLVLSRDALVEHLSRAPL